MQQAGWAAMGVATVRIRISLLANLLLWVWPRALAWRVGMGLVPGIGCGRRVGRRGLLAQVFVRPKPTRAVEASLSSSLLGRADSVTGTFAVAKFGDGARACAGVCWGASALGVRSSKAACMVQVPCLIAFFDHLSEN